MGSQVAEIGLCHPSESRFQFVGIYRVLNNGDPPREEAEFTDSLGARFRISKPPIDLIDEPFFQTLSQRMPRTRLKVSSMPPESQSVFASSPVYHQPTVQQQRISLLKHNEIGI